jgi:hypothetical protein
MRSSRSIEQSPITITWCVSIVASEWQGVRRRRHPGLLALLRRHDEGAGAVVRTIRLSLDRANDGALKEGFFLDLLRRSYSSEEAQAQLDVAIDWGRYAELYEYDAQTSELTRNLDDAHAGLHAEGHG